MNNLILKIFALLGAAFVSVRSQNSLTFWCFECRNGECVKVPFKDPNLRHPVGSSVCRLTCGGYLGTLWPRPTGQVNFNGDVVSISRKIKYLMPFKSKSGPFWKACKSRIEVQLKAKVPQHTVASDFGNRLTIGVLIPPHLEDVEPELTYETDESYSIMINTTASATSAVIEASNYFGARHGLETLSQLIVFDEVRHTFVTLASGVIRDKPHYKHRGLLFDSTANYFSVRSIERMIDAMGMVKLNRLRWRAFNYESFSVVIKSQPDLHMLGAAAPWKAYTHTDVAHLVEYARVRGVALYPEFSSFIRRALKGWQARASKVCLELGCLPWNQDASSYETFAVVEDVSREVFAMFNSNVIHFDTNVRDAFYDKVLETWASFQPTGVSGDRNRTVISWAEGYGCDTQTDMKCIIVANEQNVPYFLDKGFAVIVPYMEGLYSGSFPIDIWERVYWRRFDYITANNSEIYGVEARFYSQFTDENTLDADLWPKASAFAERMWTNPHVLARADRWRIAMHLQRFSENGVAVRALFPTYCALESRLCFP